MGWSYVAVSSSGQSFLPAEVRGGEDHSWVQVRGLNPPYHCPCLRANRFVEFYRMNKSSSNAKLNMWNSFTNNIVFVSIFVLWILNSLEPHLIIPRMFLELTKLDLLFIYSSQHYTNDTMKQQQWSYEISEKVLNAQFALLLHQRSLKIHSAPIRRNPQKAPVTLRASWKGTENWVFHPKTTRRKCSAGQRVPSSQRKSWKPCAKLIEKAGTLWWACPTPAVSGDVARVRSAPYVEELLIYTDAETCTLRCSPAHLNWSGVIFFH